MFENKDDLYYKQLKFNRKFNRLMFELNMFNKFNKTYKIYLDEETNYGFKGRIYNEIGLSFQTLMDKKEIIQENLCCLLIIDTEDFQEFAYIKIITEPVDKSIIYECPKVKPWEMYLGLSHSLNKIKINVNSHHMFLIAGATGSGKTRFFYMMLLSWIINCEPNEVELYLSDVAKNEFIGFKKCNHVKYCVSELEELYEMVLFLETKMEERKKLVSTVREDWIATNISEFNKTQKQNLAYCYVFIDEFSILMIHSSDTKEVKQMKQKIVDFLCELSKTGRGLGIFCILATQKTVRDEIPSIIKSNCAVRISFRANDSKSSESIMEDRGAVGLADRVAVYSLSGGQRQNFLFSPTIELEHIKKLLKTHMKTNKRNDSHSNQFAITQIVKTKVISHATPRRIRPNIVATQANNTKLNHYQPVFSAKEDDCIDY